MGNIVLVGAGGTGMSGVAGILQELGFTNIICIDSTQSQLTDNLQKKGFKVIIGHGIYQPKIDDAIIYSEAAVNSPEVTGARALISQEQKMMLIMNYFEFLGEVSKYFTTIGITGTNGKSSTTALAIYGAKDIPTFGLGILGAMVPDFNNQSYLINPNHKEEIKTIFIKIFTGKTPTAIDHKKLLFIVEACEYKRHFLHLDLDYAAITNIEYDHADYYKTFDDYKHAFKEMLTKLKQKCFVLQGFLESNPEFKLSQNIQEIPERQEHFDYIFGPHTSKNAALTLALLRTQDSSISTQKIQQFKGLRRRLEYLGTTQNGAKLFSDYGHMASSIVIGYQSLKQKFPDKKITAIFQPHQINRIFTGRDDFVQSFKGFDKVIIYDIYAAREDIAHFDFSKRGQNINSVEELGHNFANACGGTYSKERAEIKQQIEQADNNHIIAIFSAGDIDYEIRTHLSIKPSTI
ncbi:UDP-N-acetylmuramate-L-alanine ligase [candidate division SR1 bacterium RAAC1_SR1_1]|nr:UDP-N-acetylmuramate-L-alanine ligase [candidate division SR1 bacterium RAAC1_SR1_1]